jgi:FtsP/CotA-like multicopper oxidase with cupredoxin domain
MTTDNKDNDGVSRREFLQVSWTLAAGVALPSAGLVGCSGDAGTGTVEFPEPQVLASSGGVLDMVLTLDYLTTMINGKTLFVRSMNKSIPAPTLRVNVGDMLRIRVDNKLPPNPSSTEPAVHLRFFNSTNLHTHGLHVSPGIIRPGIYGDFVVDDPDMGIKPGESRQHEFQIGPDHPTGAYWYHPHLHGSTAIQLASGMAGMLIIGGGPVDRVPQIAAAQERIFVFQSPITDANGRLESFTQVADQPANEQNFLINGIRQPRITMRRGEVQKWQMVNAGIFNFVNFAVDSHTLHVYGQDGNPRRNILSIAPPDPAATGSPEFVLLAPGNRASVLVQAGAPGTYQLRNKSFQIGSSGNTTPPGGRVAIAEDIIGELVVLDDPLQMSLPTSPLPVPPDLAPITDEELAAHGGMKRNIVLRAVFNNPLVPGTITKPPITDAPASNVVHPGSEINDWVFQTGSTTMANTVFTIGTVNGAASTNPGMPAEFIPFQSHRAIKQTVPLGAVEEWTLFNMNNIRHPFHIHVNPCYVVKINGVAVEPYWLDTIPLPSDGSANAPTSVTFRSRFDDFKGLTVMHCHMLAHEDMGMMQAVDIV